MALTQIKSSNIADGTVVAADIADGSITNTDIKSDAAIATTKLSGALTSIASHGLPTFGTAAALAVGTGASQIVQMTTAPAKLPVVDGSNLTGIVSLTADQSWTGSQRATLVVDNDGSFDMNLGQNFKCTPSGNFALTFTNHANGQSGYIILINSGGHTVSLHANSKADANLATTVTAAGTYILSYIGDGTNAYLTNSAIMA